jgi:membrane protease YdiL (CAAX protease family)
MSSQSQQQFSWRLFWLLFIAAVFSALAVIPFAFDLFGPVISAQPQSSSPPLPFPLIIAIGVVQNLLLIAVMIFVGLKLGRGLGLGAPILAALVAGKGLVSSWKRSVSSGLLVGVVLGVVLLGLVLLLVPLLPKLPFVAAAKVAIWKRVLVCFYGGIYEELLMRFFLVTLIAWIVGKLSRERSNVLTSRAFWIANIVVAILFGLGHLPSAALVMPITPLVLAAALSLNGIAAIAFGLLYRKYGLESAMIAHFTADFVLYVIGVSFL